MAGSVGHEAAAGTSDVSSEGPSPEMRRLLRDDESLLWRGTPDRRAMVFSALVGAPFAIGVLVFGVGGLFAGFAWAAGDVTMMGAAKILGGVWLGLSVLAAVGTLAQIRHLEYAVTDQRVIEFGGIIGRDASTVRLEDVQDLEAGAGIMTKMFGVGGVSVDVPGGGGPGTGQSEANSGIDFMYIEDHRDVQNLIADARKGVGDGGRP